MYKLIAIDLDGTLLNSYGEVSNENKISIKNAIDKGVQVVLCSGRISNSVENIANEVGANNYLIGGNGTIIYNIKEQQVLYNRYMDKDLVLKLVQICDENSIYYSVFAENSILASSLKYNVLFYNIENAKKAFDKKTKINIVPNIYEYIKQSSIKEFSKVTICDSNKIIFDGIIKKIRQIKKLEILDVSHLSSKKIKNGTEMEEINYYYTEITKKNTNKWTAIKFLINKLGIKENEVMAIGDNTNDVEMIKNAGLGVVMGNSAPHVKKVGDVIVKTNNENGVSQAIETYVNSDYFNYITHL